MTNVNKVPMRKVRFMDPSGAVRTGNWTEQGIEFSTETYDQSDVVVLPPCTPTKIINYGHNQKSYVDANEGGGHPDLEEGVEWPETPADIPRQIRAPNTVLAHGDTATIYKEGETNLVYQLELGFVFSKQAKNVSEADAMDYVEGYTCINDITNLEGRYWVGKKTFDSSMAIGPVIASPDELPEDAAAEVRVNGETEMESRVDLIHPVSALIEDITFNRTFEAGDVISTGCIRKSGSLSDGDSIELEIEGIGTLQHDVRIFDMA